MWLMEFRDRDHSHSRSNAVNFEISVGMKPVKFISYKKLR
jgi:hypothetical protein